MLSSTLCLAEREFGRLLQALEEPGRTTLWRPDSLRREVLASFALEGRLIDWEDLVVAELNAGLVGFGNRAGAIDVRRLKHLAERLLLGLTTQTGAVDDTPLEDDDVADELDELADEESPGPELMATDDILSDIRSTTSDLNTFLASLSAPQPKTQDGHLSPLSPDWLTAVWTRLAGDAAALTDIATELAERLDAALAKPGLQGVAAALGVLHTPDLFPVLASPSYDLPDPDLSRRLAAEVAERKLAGPGWQFARLLAPWLIQRACQLEEPGPWLSVMLKARHGYSHAACAGGRDWEEWCLAALADGLQMERLRLVRLCNLERDWLARAGGARASNRTPKLIPLLFERPAVTVGAVKSWFTRMADKPKDRVTFRGAQLMIDNLTNNGVLVEISGRRLDRVWVAPLLR